MTTLDLITIGRSSVDLYGGQIGGRLEDMRSFDKYIGGSPTNIACGTARLGLRSAVITGVGDEHMGRFIREQLQREGVDTRGVKIDPQRLTALVLLGIRDQEQFPLIFYRENCADMGLTVEDIDPQFICEARAVVATGTHLSHPQVEAATIKALEIARQANMRTALDIDYRPNLWGVAGHGEGESRFVASDQVTSKLQSTLHLFDLIVGTEEEFICKRGAAGAVAFPGDIPAALDEGISGPGFSIDVFNVLGAGDGFMSGLLKAWLDGEALPTMLKYANACGAFAVSRHGCTPAYPSWQELQFFFDRGIKQPDLRNDAELEQIHWSTNRSHDWSRLRVFAFDHRSQLEVLDGASIEKIGAFKQLCVEAVRRVADGRSGYGLLCDDRLGRDALYQASDYPVWIGRPVEWPGSRPLALEPSLGPDFGALAEWPANHVVKVLCFCHPDDDEKMWADQESTVVRLFHSCRRQGLELLLEVIASKSRLGDQMIDDTTTAKLIDRFYNAGVYPDWWKLEPLLSDNAWQQTINAIEKHDPNTRGIVVLGLGESEARLVESFRVAAQYPLVKGFAVGRTIFADSAKAWMQGTLTDEQAISTMADNYQRLCVYWDQAKAGS